MILSLKKPKINFNVTFLLVSVISVMTMFLNPDIISSKLFLVLMCFVAFCAGFLKYSQERPLFWLLSFILVCPPTIAYLDFGANNSDGEFIVSVLLSLFLNGMGVAVNRFTK